MIIIMECYYRERPKDKSGRPKRGYRKRRYRLPGKKTVCVDARKVI